MAERMKIICPNCSGNGCKPPTHRTICGGCICDICDGVCPVCEGELIEHTEYEAMAKRTLSPEEIEHWTPPV